MPGREGTMSESPRSPSHFPGGIPQGAQGADLAFYTIADRYLDDSMRAYPTGSTMAGYHEYDGLLEDLGAAAILEKIDMARRFQAELAPIDPRSLTTSARIDHRLVTNDVDATLLSLSELRPHERDPQSYVDLLGNSTLYLTLLDPGSPAWSDRLASLLSRMQQVPRFLSDARANLKNPPHVMTDMVIHTNAGSIAFFERTAPNQFGRAPALAPRLKRENARVLEALRDYERWLEEDLLPGRLKPSIRARAPTHRPPDDDTFVVAPPPAFMAGVAVAFFNPPPILEPDLKKSLWISSVPRAGSPEEDRVLEESFLREYN